MRQRHRPWTDGAEFYGPLTNFDAPPIAQRHLCSGGGFGNIAQIVSDVVGGVAAPFTGGLSLALPFLTTGIENIATGDWSNIGGQLAGDALSAVPFGVGEFLGPAAGGALSGVADTAGGVFDALGGTMGGAPAALAGPLGEIGAGAGEAAIGGLPGLLEGLAGGAGGGFGGGGGGWIGGGLDGGGGEFTVPTTPSIAPGPGGSLPDMGPIGSGGGSAYSAADPFGAGGPVGGDLGGSASGSATAQYSGFGVPTTGTTGGPTSSVPALDPNGGGPGNIAPDPGTFPGTPAGGQLPMPGGVPQSATAADLGAVGSTPAGAGGGAMSALSQFLKDNRSLISTGLGAAGVGNAIWKNSQMQGGIDALISQAKQSQMFMSQFQNGYNQLLNQAIPLIQQGANGQINPGQAASLLASANRMKTEIKAKYASMGGTGGQSGTNLQQDLNNVDNIISGLRQAMAMGQLEAGVRLAGGAGGFGGLNQGALSSVGQFARLNAASDAELTDALGSFARAATSYGS